MPSSGAEVKPRRTRKTPEARRAEIVQHATALALSDGLESITLRSIADALGITGGLIGYYFPSVDTLLAEVFVGIAEAELEATFGPVEEQTSPVAAIRLLVATLVSEEEERVSALWIDAWHAGRRRPALRDEVARLMQAWLDRTSAIIESGLAAGVFHTDDANAAAMRILAVYDGLSIGSVMRGAFDYSAVKSLLVTVTAAELSLPISDIATE
ncbi:TetR/AcrR family transcriptional regulator [Mycobacterium kyogaense]|uniref:TetR/AcrR family transcriptional regulator n=1 Tax=Mycobacterium kyogaense TaxID=2212479 RepID=UPI000DAF33AC|nr:TetR family transcriptional regulator C-terminal domain-containing protein [Mycobacterium kyogaense]